MARQMYSYDFKCPNCDKSLRSQGNYNHVRLVLDVKGFYYLATDNLNCNVCKRTILSYDDKILNQFPFGISVKFPIVLT